MKIQCSFSSLGKEFIVFDLVSCSTVWGHWATAKADIAIEITCLTSHSQLHESLHIFFCKDDREFRFPECWEATLCLISFTNIWFWGTHGIVADVKMIHDSSVFLKIREEEGILQIKPQISNTLVLMIACVPKTPEVDCQYSNHRDIFFFRFDPPLPLGCVCLSVFLFRLQIQVRSEVLSKLRNLGFQSLHASQTALEI